MAINHRCNYLTQNKHWGCVNYSIPFFSQCLSVISCHALSHAASDCVSWFSLLHYRLIYSPFSIVCVLPVDCACGWWMGSHWQVIWENTVPLFCRLICQQGYLPTQASLITPQQDRHFVASCVWVMWVCISVALFGGGHFSSEWDFVFRAVSPAVKPIWGY